MSFSQSAGRRFVQSAPDAASFCLDSGNDLRTERSLVVFPDRRDCILRGICISVPQNLRTENSTVGINTGRTVLCFQAILSVIPKSCSIPEHISLQKKWRLFRFNICSAATFAFFCRSTLTFSFCIFLFFYISCFIPAYPARNTRLSPPALQRRNYPQP